MHGDDPERCYVRIKDFKIKNNFVAVILVIVNTNENDTYDHYNTHNVLKSCNLISIHCTIREKRD